MPYQYKTKGAGSPTQKKACSNAASGNKQPLDSHKPVNAEWNTVGNTKSKLEGLYKGGNGMKYDTKSDAVHAWVREMNCFPQGMIEQLIKHDIDSFYEITPISNGDRVWSNEYQSMGTVSEIYRNEDDGFFAEVELDDVINEDDEPIKINTKDLSLEYDDYLPMWGWMWQFGDSADDWWLENHLQEMADCGFRIYEHSEWGYFFGIDGAGYNFYEAHWTPLYDKRGLHWHKEA